jgi:hypothetical protein
MKITKLDDLKNYTGNLNVTPDKALAFVEQHLGKAQYDAFLSLFGSQQQAQEFLKTIGSYSLIKERSYGFGVDELRRSAGENHPQFTFDDGRKIYRLLSFKENMIARIEHPKLFDAFLNSCTGVAHKAGSSLIKIAPLSEALIGIDRKDFNKAYLPVDYASFQGEELDAKTVGKEDKWLISMGGINPENKELYAEYQNALLKNRPELKKNDVMNFYTRNNPSQNELRALCVGNGIDLNDSDAGSGSLLYWRRFLRVV